VSQSISGPPRREYDPATQSKRPERSLGELFSEMTSDVTALVRKEIELAKVEAKEEATRLGRGAGMFVGAGLGGWYALLFVSFALAWLLDQAINTALAFAIVGLLWVGAALILAIKGKQDIKSVKGLPQTTQTLKEDVEWAKQQKS
jgi:uncharacterized membrane protein YqjE